MYAHGKVAPAAAYGSRCKARDGGESGRIIRITTLAYIPSPVPRKSVEEAREARLGDEVHPLPSPLSPRRRGSLRDQSAWVGRDATSRLPRCLMVTFPCEAEQPNSPPRRVSRTRGLVTRPSLVLKQALCSVAGALWFFCAMEPDLD